MRNIKKLIALTFPISLPIICISVILFVIVIIPIYFAIYMLLHLLYGLWTNNPFDGKNCLCKTKLGTKLRICHEEPCFYTNWRD